MVIYILCSFVILGKRITLKKIFTILCLISLLAPLACKWAAYVHCKLAAETLEKDCGCDAIITNHPPTQGDHSAPAQLVHQNFSDWQFETYSAIVNITPPFIDANPYNFFKNQPFPSDWIADVFIPLPYITLKAKTSYDIPNI